MSSALYRNDRVGAFPDSWYVATVDHPSLRPDLRGSHTADVCVVGAGYTGLSAARVLAQAGLRVIVLDAHRAGFGASGRNGGQVASGYNASQRVLAQKLGAETAKDLWTLTEEAKADIATFGDTIQHTPGVAHGCYSDGERADISENVAFLNTAYGYDKVEVHDQADFAKIVNTPLYKGGVIDKGAAHIHPLRYALALAKAAEDAGAQIYETSPVHHVAKGAKLAIRTSKGRVTVDHVVLATNGYIGGLERAVAAKVMPMNSFIVATEPLVDQAQNVLSQNIAVEDSKHFVNYYRLSDDKRLLFGGRASARTAFPKDIASILTPRMTQLFPQLAGARIDYAWGGALGVTTSALPAIQRIGPNIVSAGGFTGHGVALSGLCGKILGEAILGQASRFDTLASLPTPNFPAGHFGGRSLLSAFVLLANLRERLGV
ncbi:MAG: FAD-binding oxidoreductase [Pseudomonadota bacterium]